MPTLTQALSRPGATYLVYLHRADSPDGLTAVAKKAAATAQTSPSYGAALVDTDSLDANERALLGDIEDVDVVLLSHGIGIDRTRLATYPLEQVNTPLKMMDAWSKDS